MSEINERIEAFLKQYKNLETKRTVVLVLSLIKNNLDINEINKIIDNLAIKGNTKNLYISYARQFLKWCNNEYNQTHKIHKLKRFINDRKQKQSYSNEETRILKKALTDFNCDWFEFLALLQWENFTRSCEIISVDWKMLEQNNFSIEVNVAKNKERIEKRAICVPEYLQPKFLVVKNKLIAGINLKTYKNTFSKFAKFVKNQHPSFTKQISSHCLRADKITKIYKEGISIDLIMTMTRHKNAQVLREHYINDDAEMQIQLLKMVQSKDFGIRFLEKNQLINNLEIVNKQIKIWQEKATEWEAEKTELLKTNQQYLSLIRLLLLKEKSNKIIHLLKS